MTIGADQSLKTAQKPGFRHDLQGLRALAVVLVMCYHIWFSRVSGGVDIFLMLSAFFLTASTAKRITRGETPNILTAWAHRFSRLIPQAAVVVAAVAITAWVTLPSSRWMDLIDQARASLMYYQNWFLASHQVDYYAFNTSSASAFQHFWSLSVQGQIFILWPLLLIGSALVWRRYFAHRSYALVAGGCFGIVFALSLAFSIFYTYTNQQVAYFHTGARLWEFALGSLLALSLPWISKQSQKLRRVLGWVGLFTIISCGALLDVQGQFPGFMALVPTLGAALIIAAPAERRWRNPSGILSAKPLTKLGDLSYGMYLWHWPLLVFYLSLSGSEHAGAIPGTLLIIISIALSWVSTNLVEKPVGRWQSNFDFRGRFTGAKAPVLAGAMVMIMGVGVASLPVLALEGNVEYRRMIAAAQAPDENPGAMASQDWDPSPAALTLPLATDLDGEWQIPGEECSGVHAPDDERIDFCQQGGSFAPGRPVLVMLGDSHMQHWSDAGAQMMEKAGGSWILLHHPGCRYGSLSAAAAEEDCGDFQEAARDYITDMVPTWVMTNASMTQTGYDELLRSPGEREAMVDGYAEGIQPFIDAGSTVIAVRDTPRYEYLIPECVDVNRSDPSACDGSAAELLNAHNPVDQFIARGNYGGSVVSLELTDLLCPDGVCKAVIGNVLTYIDNSHLSKTFIDSAAEQFTAKFAQATGWPESDK